MAFLASWRRVSTIHAVTHASVSTIVTTCVQACSGRKGVVYDYFNQYCPSVTLTNSDWFTNFGAGYDSACTGNELLHVTDNAWSLERICIICNILRQGEFHKRGKLTVHLASQICNLVTCSMPWKYKQCHTCPVPWIVVHVVTMPSTIAVALRPFQIKVGINVKCNVLSIPACKSVQTINNSCVTTSDASPRPEHCTRVLSAPLSSHVC